MAVTHTAGPWVGFVDQNKPHSIIPAMRQGEICGFSSSPNDADFQLMIAAPDLLSALKAMDAALCDGFGTRETRTANRKALIAARAAVAKAEGRP